MFVATFDNPATMCREAWQDGRLVAHISAALLDSRDFRGHPSMHMGLSGGPFKPGLLWGDMRALGSLSKALEHTKPKDEDPEKLARLIASRVNGFGPASARKLVFRLRTLDNIINAEPADLDAIFGKGSIKSIHLRKYLDDPVAVERLRERLQTKPKDGE